MQLKYPILVFLLLILASGCASSPKMVQEDITSAPLETIISSKGLSTATSEPPIHTDTPDPKFISKQDDLIFIEFFAGT